MAVSSKSLASGTTITPLNLTDARAHEADGVEWVDDVLGRDLIDTPLEGLSESVLEP